MSCLVIDANLCSFKLTDNSPFGFQILDSRDHANSPERFLCAITGAAALSKSEELKKLSGFFLR